MEIVYLITVLILLISFVLVKKSDKEINIFNFICISIVCLFCYNTFICYILTFFVIPITLNLLSIINIFVSSIFIIKILINKKIQKFNFNKADILYIILITLVVSLISYINFDFPFEINYETGDPSVHYLTSVMFAESEALLPNIELDDVYGDISQRKTVSYVNSGLLMKCFCPDIDAFECYNVFVWFGIFTLLLIGFSLYFGLKKFSKNTETRFLAFIVSLICLLGYPLNSFLFGFEYLTMGLLMFCVIVDLIYYYDNKLLNFPWLLLILGFLNFGLFSSYYMFVPFVYTTLWIYFCMKNYKDTKKIITKKLILILTITLLIPFILGMVYHLFPEIYDVLIDKSKEVNVVVQDTVLMSNQEQTEPAITLNDINNTVANEEVDEITKMTKYLLDTGFAVEGYTYTNLYSNMLLLLPLTFYLFIKKTKDKDLESESFLGILLLLTCVFIEVLLILNCYRKVSFYYISKNYYVLWIILAFTNYKALIMIYDNKKYLTRIFISIYIVLMIICTIFSNVIVDYIIGNLYEKFYNVMDIFGANKTILFEKPSEYNIEELEILKYVKENMNPSMKIEIVTDENAYYWQYAILRYVNKEEEYRYIDVGQEELTDKWERLEEKVNKVDYIVYFNKTDKYMELEDRLFENAEIIFKNSVGGVIKYNN